MGAVRDAVLVPCPDPEEAVRLAIASDRRPVVLVDLGDNVGGGSAGDGTVLLAELIRQRARDAVVVLYDPDAVGAAQASGIGGRFERAVGGRVDRLHGEPVPVAGRRAFAARGDLGRRPAPARRPPVQRPGGDGGRRARWADPAGAQLAPDAAVHLGQLTSLGIDPARQAILVVKAAVAYKAAYGPIAGRVIEVDTPGLTAIDPRRFSYHRVRRPLFPLDDPPDEFLSDPRTP